MDNRAQCLDVLRPEVGHRVFADPQRRCRLFPRAFEHWIGDVTRGLVWGRWATG
jgi:hypothetical protein